jgi:hypothetical protein
MTAAEKRELEAALAEQMRSFSSFTASLQTITLLVGIPPALQILEAHQRSLARLHKSLSEIQAALDRARH